MKYKASQKTLTYSISKFLTVHCAVDLQVFVKLIILAKRSYFHPFFVCLSEQILCNLDQISSHVAPR